MKFIKQNLDTILKNLSPLQVDWRDDVAKRVIKRIEQFSVKNEYNEDDIKNLFSEEFEDAQLICRLFLGLSKDAFTVALRNTLGVNCYKEEPDKYIKALIGLGLLEAMATEVNRKTKWSDVLIERLRSGRGSAIIGQRRGRGLEDFVEEIIIKIFGKSYVPRCKFTGKRGQSAKCDFAIPDKENPRILIEIKAYGATGSKMTDVVGDVDAIVEAKRNDTTLLLFTDGLTWNQRQSDLKKLVERQNSGDVSRIYTTSMRTQFEVDLVTLKKEYKI